MRLFVLAGCFFVTALGTSTARAGGGGEAVGGGTITFVGAIVAPTCSMPVESAETSTALPVSGSRQICAVTGSGTTNPARVYDLNLQHLSSAEPDRVLQYFGNYVRATGGNAADPVLLIQTYE
jgi:type 1 fimbria pilin